MITGQDDALTKLYQDDLRQQFIDNRDDKSYRHAYADESLNISIATQIKVLREQRKLKQRDLALLAGMKQSMISRYENVNYSSWSINTLKKLAEAFDVVLDVRFRSFEELVEMTQEFSRETLQVKSFCDDPYFFERRHAPRLYTVHFTFQPPTVGNVVVGSAIPVFQLHGDIRALNLRSSQSILYKPEITEAEGESYAEEEKAGISSARNLYSSRSPGFYTSGLYGDQGQRVSAY